jgi:NAD(P)-dependent dehydrogenase (short-subunit alcohol dehydrogenase family)
MKDKSDIVVVWGATSGVGTQLIKELCKDQTTIIAYARNPLELDGLVTQFPNLTVRQFEIAEDFYRRECDHLRQKQYKITGMVDCVGSITIRSDATLTDRLQDVLTPNLYHQYFSTQIFSELFSNNASVVYLSSVRAKTGTDNANIEYAFAKAALENLAKSFIHTFKEKRIRVNVVRPTPILNTKLSAKWPAKLIDDLSKKSIYNELLTPSDIVPVIQFLLSEKSRSITGSVIDVTNGFEAN